LTIRIVSIGKTNFAFVREAVSEYLKRMQRYAKVQWEELPDVKNVDRNDETVLRRREGALILERISPADTLVLLDERGKSFDSIEFAQWLDRNMTNTTKDLVFVIGGAYGFSQEVYDRADMKLSLSRMTFSHQIIRAIFAEQLYRAFTIRKGEPYHHA